MRPPTDQELLGGCMVLIGVIFAVGLLVKALA